MSGQYRAARAEATSKRTSPELSMSRRLIATTGRSFDEWFDILDKAGAEDWPHWRIMRYLAGKRKNDEWWASAVAKAYERARGLDAASGPSFNARVTKTLDAPLDVAWLLVDDEDERRSWLDVELEECSRPSETSLISQLADGSRVTIALREATPGNPGQTRATITHSGVPKEDALAETKAFWRSALARLADIVAEERETE